MVDVFNMCARGVSRLFAFRNINDPLEQFGEVVGMCGDGLIALTEILEKWKPSKPAPT